MREQVLKASYKMDSIVRIDREAVVHAYYSYDAADRLTGEHWLDATHQSLYAFSWDYDAVGNRTYQLDGMTTESRRQVSCHLLEPNPLSGICRKPSPHQ